MPRKPSLAAPASKPRAYGYVRVSTDSQAEDGQSLDVQQRQLEGWAMQRGAVLDAVHVEAGVSGAVPFHERPEGGRLWQLAQRGDTLVASKLDRMFRSASDCLAVVEAFKARGVSLFLLDLNGGADDVSGNGIARLFLTIVSAFAEFERDRIGERIRATKQRQKASGEYSGGSAVRLHSRRRPPAGAGEGATGCDQAHPHAARQGPQLACDRHRSRQARDQAVACQHREPGERHASGPPDHRKQSMRGAVALAAVAGLVARVPRPDATRRATCSTSLPSSRGDHGIGDATVSRSEGSVSAAVAGIGASAPLPLPAQGAFGHDGLTGPVGPTSIFVRRTMTRFPDYPRRSPRPSDRCFDRPPRPS